MSNTHDVKIQVLIQKARAVVWKVNHNDASGPAKIDRNDVVIRQLEEALGGFELGAGEIDGVYEMSDQPTCCPLCGMRSD
ncbi:MAG: hypothetical protein ACREPQ_13770 [Rhodanobacter sp.]